MATLSWNLKGPHGAVERRVGFNSLSVDGRHIAFDVFIEWGTEQDML